MMAFWICMMAMTLLSIAYTLTTTYVLHLDYPYGPPLFFTDDRWFDFTIYHDRFQHFRTASFWDKYEYPFTYPAPLGVLYGVLYKIPHALRYYLICYAGLLTACALVLVRRLRKAGLGAAVAVIFVVTTVVFSYPLRVLFESANTEGVTALLAGLGVLAVLRNRCWMGGMLIAVAGTMKIFPFVLLALLLSKKKYREFAWSLVVAAVVSVASLAIVGPTVGEAQRHIDAGIAYVKYTFIFATNPAAVTFNHSLFTLVKFGVVGLRRAMHPMVIHNHADFLLRKGMERALLDTTFTAYVALAALFGLVLYFGWMRRLPMLNQLVALTACAVVLPPLSADYTLLHLLLPFALLCLYATQRWRAGVAVPGLSACLFWFAPIFSFQTYITYRYRFSCEFRTLALLGLLWTAMRYPLWWAAVDEPDESRL
jgi:hypothetical protein